MEAKKGTTKVSKVINNIEVTTSTPVDVVAVMEPRFPDALRSIKAKAKIKLLPVDQVFDNLKAWTISTTISPNVEDRDDSIKIGAQIQMAGGIVEELIGHNFSLKDPMIKFKPINRDDAAPAIEVAIKREDISPDASFDELSMVANATQAMLLIVVAIANIITDYSPNDDLVKELFEILERVE